MSGSKNSRKGSEKGNKSRKLSRRDETDKSGSTRAARRGYMTHVQENEAGAFGPKDRYLAVNL